MSSQGKATTNSGEVAQLNSETMNSIGVRFLLFSIYLPGMRDQSYMELHILTFLLVEFWATTYVFSLPLVHEKIGSFKEPVFIP